jgi:hypothetical protein
MVSCCTPVQCLRLPLLVLFEFPKRYAYATFSTAKGSFDYEARGFFWGCGTCEMKASEIGHLWSGVLARRSSSGFYTPVLPNAQW